MSQLFFIAFRAMGCEMTAQLETEHDGQAILRALPDQVEAIEGRLSRFRPHSELMQLNAQAGTWVEVSQVLFDNIYAAKQAARLTDGAFNPLVLPAMIANGYDRTFVEIAHPSTTPTVPVPHWQGIELRLKTHEVRIPPHSALDLGGIAKGWAAAALADTLAVYGACLVNIGGDLVARGAPQGLPGWQITIDDPQNGTKLLSLWLSNAGIVTSGTDYRHWTTANGEQKHHIIDPRTGQSAQTDVSTVTIVHRNVTYAEAYAKAVLLQGAEIGLNWLQSQWDAAGFVVRHDGAVFATPEFLSLIHERNFA